MPPANKKASHYACCLLSCNNLTTAGISSVVSEESQESSEESSVTGKTVVIGLRISSEWVSRHCLVHWPGGRCNSTGCVVFRGWTWAMGKSFKASLRPFALPSEYMWHLRSRDVGELVPQTRR